MTGGFTICGSGGGSAAQGGVRTSSGTGLDPPAGCERPKIRGLFMGHAHEARIREVYAAMARGDGRITEGWFYYEDQDAYDGFWSG